MIIRAPATAAMARMTKKTTKLARSSNHGARKSAIVAALAFVVCNQYASVAAMDVGIKRAVRFLVINFFGLSVRNILILVLVTGV
jgi:hypothetical protein